MKKLLLTFIMLFAFTTISSCIEVEPSVDSIEITDMIGRVVTIPTKIEKVVCVGAGSLRLFSYFGQMDKLVGVEDVEKTRTSKVTIRPYQLAYENLLANLPSCGVGGPSGSADAEKILACNPDIIFSLYTSDKSEMDKLQAQTGTPVVTFSYGSNAPFNETTLNAITLMGKILGGDAISRAKEITDYIKNVQNTIQNTTKDVSKDKTAYLGCNSSWGTQGITSTSINYAPMTIANVRNAASEYLNIHTDKTVSEIDLEALVDMNPSVIILDTGGLSILKNEYSNNTQVLESLDAVKNGQIFLQMPFNAYYTNIEMAIANAYFIASSVYPEAFTDFDINKKTSEIMTFFFGKDVYPTIQEMMRGGYQQITNLGEFLK